MCENSRRRSGGAAAAAAAADLRHVNILPPLRSVMRIQCSGESSRLAEARRRRRRRRSRKKSNPARVHKVISSSGIKQTKQSYTSCNLSDCLHARTFLSTPPNPTHTLPNVCECDRAASEHSVESNIRKTFSMRTIQLLLCCEIILDFIIPAPSLCLLD